MERLDISGFARNEPWAPIIELLYSGGDLPPIGNIRLQWRRYEGAPGAPLFDLTSVAFEEIAASPDEIAAGLAEEGDRILRLFPGIGVAGMQTLPSGLNEPEPGEADRYVWDAVIHYTDDQSERVVGGFSYIEKGVTLSGE